MSDKVVRLRDTGSPRELLEDLLEVADDLEGIVVSVRIKGDGDVLWSEMNFGDACVHDVQMRDFIIGFRKMMTDGKDEQT